MKQNFSFGGQMRPGDVRPDPYLYLPFTAPPRTTRIDVSYTFDEPVIGDFGLGIGNEVGIGIFDPRGVGFLEDHGFRGWSGAARREFFLSPNEATPGYLRGAIIPGQWNIALEFVKTMESGVRYEVRVDLTVDDKAEGPGAMAASSIAPANGGPARREPRKGGGWFKGDLHCHTVHSDGLNSVEEIARGAQERGLDFLAVTDHNTNTHHEELARLSHLDILLIPGEEITTCWGHANMWGLREWIDFRCADAEAAQAVRRFVLRKGGLISVNHPKAVGPPWMFLNEADFPCMEVWQAPWRWFNWESLERWEALLRRGRRIVAVGGSDTHSIPPARPMHPHGLGEPTTWAYVPGPLTEENVLAAIRQGHIFISEKPSGPQLHLTADADGEGRYEAITGDTVPAKQGGPLALRVRCQGAAGRRLWLLADGEILSILSAEREDYSHDFSIEAAPGRFVRAELREYRGALEQGESVLAMTNPIYLA